MDALRKSILHDYILKEEESCSNYTVVDCYDLGICYMKYETDEDANDLTYVLPCYHSYCNNCIQGSMRNVYSYVLCYV